MIINNKGLCIWYRQPDFDNIIKCGMCLWWTGNVATMVGQGIHKSMCMEDFEKHLH